MASGTQQEKDSQNTQVKKERLSALFYLFNPDPLNNIKTSEPSSAICEFLNCFVGLTPVSKQLMHIIVLF